MAGAPKGNRNGEKKNRLMTEALRRELLQYEAEGVARGEAASIIARKLIAKALEGDQNAIEEIYDRIDGKPAQTVDMNINDERPSRDAIAQELARLHASLTERGYGRGTEPDPGSVPGDSTTH